VLNVISNSLNISLAIVSNKWAIEVDLCGEN
jgi:hypothetical protein